MTPLPRKILLDTDPGGDDAFALLWLQSLASQGIADLVAVTTTAGNVAADRTFASASQILALGGMGAVPLGRSVEAVPDSTEDATHIHGADGMGNLSTTLASPLHQYASAPRADDLIIEQLQAHPGQITLVAIGPLTNVAAAEAKAPGVLQLAQEIVVMGGAFRCSGNITAQAEFNIWFNPEAAATVLNSGATLVILPLDVSTHIVFTPAMAQEVGDRYPHSPLTTFVQQLCAFMVSTARLHRETQGIDGFLVHDAATIAYVFYPETLWCQRAQVHVETQGQWTRGQTLIDGRHRATPHPNAWVALQGQPQILLSHLVEDLKYLVHTRATEPSLT